jgi:hypothetical protein
MFHRRELQGARRSGVEKGAVCVARGCGGENDDTIPIFV